MFRTPSASLSTRLPTLEVAVQTGPLAASDGALPEDPQKLFQNEINQNITDSGDSLLFGYARLQVTEATAARAGRGFQAFQMLTFMAPSLFGMPLEYRRTSLRAEVQIMNDRGQVIGTYEGIGRSNVRVAMYHGYSQSDAPRLADADALRLALAQIRPQLETDSDTLRMQLLATEPIDQNAIKLEMHEINVSPFPEGIKRSIVSAGL
ncbi:MULTISPECIES: hypothetical protein [Hymenobacter]|uniref:Uncharacterized protein n=1 Tax=Hymenobacter jejuensis TaxID=2502781 RepID=A0A5B7ZWD8_9BACT|nr:MULTISPECIES: hypothetical protein [Hymenobacter]MBC6988479.1 hypothetical protein [Hymenobacter sp. BT491]QDA59167.1 hypothetical protein FHG12_03180 [Hymenobacter jejuensis]